MADTVIKNPRGRSYTKRDLRYLLRDENVDLNNPIGVKPMGVNELAKKIKILEPEMNLPWSKLKNLKYLPPHICDFIRDNL